MAERRADSRNNIGVDGGLYSDIIANIIRNAVDKLQLSKLTQGLWFANVDSFSRRRIGFRQAIRQPVCRQSAVSNLKSTRPDAVVYHLAKLAKVDVRLIIIVQRCSTSL